MYMYIIAQALNPKNGIANQRIGIEGVHIAFPAAPTLRKSFAGDRIRFEEDQRHLFRYCDLIESILTVGILSNIEALKRTDTRIQNQEAR